MDLKDREKAWIIVKKAQSFNYAYRGVKVFFSTTPNAFIHVFAAILVIIAGFFLKVSSTEWLFLILVIGLVFVAEAFNTAIEIDINLTSPDFHPYARDTKDVAAGAVLIAILISVIAGLIIFLPKLYGIWNTI